MTDPSAEGSGGSGTEGSGAARAVGSTGPLADLRVIDLATVLAGPGCARYLGDFGADVIKVERPGAGDTLRALGWRDPRDDVSFFWKLGGRNKRSIVLDLTDPADLAVLHRLIATAGPASSRRSASTPPTSWRATPGWSSPG